MKKIHMIFLLFFVLVFHSFCQKSYEKKLLLENWTLNVNNCPKSAKQKSDKNYVLETSVPTTLHLDLLKHKKIEDPFFGNNWQQQKWISQCSAFYNHQIEGIDTYSTVKLNSKQILKTENAFVQYKVSVKDTLKVGKNLLEVDIIPTKSIDDKGQSENKMPFAYAHTRKPCYQYSWDWAPFMNTLGIWKNVYLEMYDQVSINYVWIQLQTLSQKQADLFFSIKTIQSEEFKVSQNYKIAISYNSSELIKTKITGTESSAEVKIENPKLWWPNGIGEPYMYNFQVRLYSGQKIIHSKNVSYGIKTVKLDQIGNKFTLYVNGYKVYCKGANYVPPDMLYPRAETSKKIESLFEDMVRSNFNMIRVWGGGQYESDEFYQLASKKGIMLFHDFMFSDSIYPSTESFLKNVQVEIVQQIRRIRNYPALVLWAGNNQILQGIQSWGWGKLNYRQDYKKLFEQFIPSIIKTQSPYIPYVPSSPVKGVGNGGFDRGGDIHYWGVWAGGANFQNYETAVGPFNSQFGTQALPVWQTIKEFTTENGRSYQSNELLSHERHNSQFHTLRKYMENYARQSLNFEMEVYQSGLVQAFAIEIAIKAQRASKNLKSMGTLYWQFNDAWPAISWSAIDYYGRWKPLQYKAKNLYEDVIAFYSHKTKKVVAINDKLYDIKCFVETKIMTFEGKVIKNHSQIITLRQNEARNITSLEPDYQTLENNGSKVFVFTKLVLPTGKQVSVSTFVKPLKFLQLPRCQLQVKFNFAQNVILLASKCLIKSVHIYHESKYLSLTENYIDVIPGQVHKTKLMGENLQQLAKQIKFKSYLQVYEKDPLKVIVKE